MRVKTLAAIAVALLLGWAAVAFLTFPAQAGYHCYTISGKYFCCNTYGNQTYCN